MLHIKTPATSANLGCGFDTIGMALKLYNELWVEEIESGLEINVLKHHTLTIPTNENNLIYKTMRDFFEYRGKKMCGVRLFQKDDIPLTRGLGSSAACIVSGLLAANVLCNNELSKYEILQMASKIEGHPDNVAPALLGGVVVGAMNENELNYVDFEMPVDLQCAVIIPDFPLSTAKARGILPKKVSLKDAVFNSSRAGLLIASLLTGKYENLNIAFDDRLHQPYRKTIIPDLENIFSKSMSLGSKGVFLSGAGPTIIAILNKNDSFLKNMTEYLSSLNNNWEISIIETDNAGAIVSDKSIPKI